MGRKFKVTAVAILATLTFATTAFAGIFDVVGAVVGGVLGVTTQPTQEQIEQFHVDYLNKVAAKIKQTGDPDAAFQDVINEQKKLGYTVSVVQNDTGQIKSFDITGNGMTVIVKSAVDRQQQLMTISYTDLQGNPTGKTLTKKYELPGGAAASAPSDDGPSPFANVKQSDNPFANATPTANPFAGASHKQEIEKAFSAKVSDGGRTYIHIPTVTGYSEFDNSILRGNKILILYAYYGASKTSKLKEVVDLANYELSRVCNEKDPFAYDAMLRVFKNLFQYYRNGGKLDLYVYTVIDYKIPVNGTCFHVATQNEDEHNRYNTRTQNLVINPWLPEANCDVEPSNINGNIINCQYKIGIPLNVAKAAYAKINEITAKNKAATSGNKTNGKVTSLRICYAYDTPISTRNDLLPSTNQYGMGGNPFVFRNATFKILAVENQYGKNNNTNWYTIVSGSGSNCAVIK